MHNTIKWQCAKIEAMTSTELFVILKARCDVFVVEQNCVFPEIDDFDLAAWHLSAWNEQNQIAAYLRILPPDSVYAEPSIGRVLTTRSNRGTGIGKELIRQGLTQLALSFPNYPVRIGAQSYLTDFYRSFGFEVVSDEYMEDGIAHVEMVLVRYLPVPTI